MSGVYYDSFVRKLSKSSKPRKSVGEAVDLDDAQYTIKSADDELPNTFDVDPAAPAKRATDGTPDERPAKRVCPGVDHVDQTLDDTPVSTSASTTSTSSSSKGKQRATPDLLSLLPSTSVGIQIKPRTMGPTPSPSSAIATSASSSSSVATSVAAPESQSGPSSISMPVLDASLATTHIPESSSTSTLAPRSSPVSTLAPGLAAPSTLAPDLLATSERATNLSTIPAVSPVPSSSSSPSALALTSLGVPVPSTKSAVTEASTAATASAKQPRPRPRRKATAWPPPEDMEGPKWAYARKWYADHHGVEAAFEQHYKGLGTTEKRKLSREYEAQLKVRHVICSVDGAEWNLLHTTRLGRAPWRRHERGAPSFRMPRVAAQEHALARMGVMQERMMDCRTKYALYRFVSLGFDQKRL
ncbi:hypothetical protein LXA43DRAFT_1069824 [Ganoderma leucocontextum]|nr:hypothetical protein LXA43DRAFT_1069824 [Ganoderma leucocontextum]